jgi:hypothetical protein
MLLCLRRLPHGNAEPRASKRRSVVISNSRGEQLIESEQLAVQPRRSTDGASLS